MKQFIIYGLAVVGGGCITYKVACLLLDRYKNDILDYAASTLVDYITDESNDENKTTAEKMKKKVLLAYLKKGAGK